LEQGFQMKGLLCMKQSGTQSGLDKWWRDEPRCLGWGTKQSLGP
jgi:hypothetical protein